MARHNKPKAESWNKNNDLTPTREHFASVWTSTRASNASQALTTMSQAQASVEAQPPGHILVSTHVVRSVVDEENFVAVDAVL